MFDVRIVFVSCVGRVALVGCGVFVGEVGWYAKVDNLFDEEARVHTSVLKNQAPLPGRSIKVGFTGTF